MVQYKNTLAFILASYNKLWLSSAVDYEDCASIEDIGESSLERFNYSVDIKTNKIDDTEGNSVCSYQLDLNFKHDDSLPLPDNPVEQCTPGPNAPMASDGMPYYAFRWYYEQVPEKIKKLTGIDNISIDFNPCGHPPLGVFTIPHYDIHFYTVSPKTRSCMICKKKFPTPACDPDFQSSVNGKAFFEAQAVVEGNVASAKSSDLKKVTIAADSSYKLANMPAGYQLGLNDMIPFMGGHAWDVSKQPNEENPWLEPFWLMGSYDSELAFYESMAPYSFVSGNTDTYFEEQISYEGQTIKNLPHTHSVSFNAESKLITFKLMGNADCDLIDDTNESKDSEINGNEDKGEEEEDTNEIGDSEINGDEGEGEYDNESGVSSGTLPITPKILMSAFFVLCLSF